MRSTALGIVLFVGLWSSLGLADTVQVVTLKSGAKYRGELVESVPDDHVSIKLATGEVKTFPWAEIASNNEVTPAAPAPGPVVHIDGTDRLTLDRASALVAVYSRRGGAIGAIYEHMCDSPCDVAVAPGKYRLDGPGVTPTSSFYIGGSQPVVLTPHMGSSALRTAGFVLTMLGSVAALLGAIYLPLGVALKNDTFTLIGGVSLGAGGAFLLAGIPMLLAGASRVDVTPPSQARIRLLPNVRLLPNGFAF